MHQEKALICHETMDDQGAEGHPIQAQLEEHEQRGKVIMAGHDFLVVSIQHEHDEDEHEQLVEMPHQIHDEMVVMVFNQVLLELRHITEVEAADE